MPRTNAATPIRILVASSPHSTARRPDPDSQPPGLAVPCASGPRRWSLAGSRIPTALEAPASPSHPPCRPSAPAIPPCAPSAPAPLPCLRAPAASRPTNAPSPAPPEILRQTLPLSCKSPENPNLRYRNIPIYDLGFVFLRYAPLSST